MKSADICCLEAIVDAEDLQAGGEESLYDDLDYLGQPVSKAEMKKRNADRAILLTELTSVIAHRMVQTREREAKALSRSRGLLESNQSPSSPSLPPPAIDEVQSMSIVNDEHDASRGEAPRGPSLDLKKRLQLRNQHFHLLIKTAEALSTQTRPDGTSHSLHVANPEGDGGVVATETLPEIFMRRPAISTDLKALILQQGRAVRSSKLEEEIFDDVGSGEELNEEELEEQ
ncbi:hypothetical protein ECG_02037 [Echinococcus granulosus]|nr:hypothetical protein ECG_02037 [Echinococcus granulosus]